jgi:anti-anti-sigma regulatory factor
MASECVVTREWEGERIVLRIAGVFDRGNAWSLRERVERETAPEVLLDFSLVRDFSDLGVAVLAQGVHASGRRVLFRGLRQHQLRIFRYCGVVVDEISAREAVAVSSAVQVPSVSDASRPVPGAPSPASHGA